MKYQYFLCIILTYKNANSQMEPFIVGGNDTNIEQHPHSLLLNIACGTRFICGGSILNQDVVLTAAHCIDKCTAVPEAAIVIKYGHENLKYMNSTKMKDFVIHHYYDEETLDYDIALLTCKNPIKLGDNVKRVVIMENPPLTDTARIAGWGVINKNRDVATTLQQTFQKIMPHEVCKALDSIPKGTFCAGPAFEGLIGQPDHGDSGSALIIQSYIQIGIVSFKLDDYSLVVYTNVSYYLSWITNQARILYCLLPHS